MISLIFFNGFLPVKPVHAQSNEINITENAATKEEKKRQKLIRDMKELVRVAHDAGFTAEELKDITIEVDGETVNVVEYLKQEEMKKQQQASDKTDMPSRSYITVQDVTKELIEKEYKEITDLRNNLILSGEKQE
ncbi:MAG: hypothetical protein HQM12_07195 [SAR324 cluster bacterium]|nr:hypothetical protein [SAR324 cluster bacterium]